MVYLFRSNFTDSKITNYINEIFIEKQIKNLNIVMNVLEIVLLMVINMDINTDINISISTLIIMDMVMVTVLINNISQQIFHYFQLFFPNLLF